MIIFLSIKKLNVVLKINLDSNTTFVVGGPTAYKNNKGYFTDAFYKQVKVTLYFSELFATLSPPPPPLTCRGCFPGPGSAEGQCNDFFNRYNIVSLG